MSAFEDFKRGDRIRFCTVRGALIPRTHGTGKKLGTVEVWRTGTVSLATAKALTIACDMPNDIGPRALISKVGWASRKVSKLPSGS